MKDATETVLGIEGGGTRTSWTLFAIDGDVLRSVREGQLPATNFRLTSRERILELWREMPRPVQRVGAFLAGCGTPADRADLSQSMATQDIGEASQKGREAETEQQGIKGYKGIALAHCVGARRCRNSISANTTPTTMASARIS